MVSPESKGTILYVEDNPDNRLLVRRILLSEDYSLLEATDAMDALNVLNRTTFANPNLDPFSTDFGRITSATAAAPRFIQFVNRFSF